jgi:hypothetical protein
MSTMPNGSLEQITLEKNTDIPSDEASPELLVDPTRQREEISPSQLTSEKSVDIPSDEGSSEIPVNPTRQREESPFSQLTPEKTTNTPSSEACSESPQLPSHPVTPQHFSRPTSLRVLSPEETSPPKRGEEQDSSFDEESSSNPPTNSSPPTSEPNESSESSPYSRARGYGNLDRTRGEDTEDDEETNIFSEEESPEFSELLVEDNNRQNFSRPISGSVTSGEDTPCEKRTPEKTDDIPLDPTDEESPEIPVNPTQQREEMQTKKEETNIFSDEDEGSEEFSDPFIDSSSLELPVNPTTPRCSSRPKSWSGPSLKLPSKFVSRKRLSQIFLVETPTKKGKEEQDIFSSDPPRHFSPLELSVKAMQSISWNTPSWEGTPTKILGDVTNIFSDEETSNHPMNSSPPTIQFSEKSPELPLKPDGTQQRFPQSSWEGAPIKKPGEDANIFSDEEEFEESSDKDPFIDSSPPTQTKNIPSSEKSLELPVNPATPQRSSRSKSWSGPSLELPSKFVSRKRLSQTSLRETPTRKRGEETNIFSDEDEGSSDHFVDSRSSDPFLNTSPPTDPPMNSSPPELPVEAITRQRFSRPTDWNVSDWEETPTKKRGEEITSSDPPMKSSPSTIPSSEDSPQLSTKVTKPYSRPISQGVLSLEEPETPSKKGLEEPPISSDEEAESSDPYPDFKFFEKPIDTTLPTESGNFSSPFTRAFGRGRAWIDLSHHVYNAQGDLVSTPGWAKPPTLEQFSSDPSLLEELNSSPPWPTDVRKKGVPLIRVLPKGDKEKGDTSILSRRKQYSDFNGGIQQRRGMGQLRLDEIRETQRKKAHEKELAAIRERQGETPGAGFTSLVDAYVAIVDTDALSTVGVIAGEESLKKMLEMENGSSMPGSLEKKGKRLKDVMTPKTPEKKSGSAQGSPKKSSKGTKGSIKKTSKGTKGSPRKKTPTPPRGKYQVATGKSLLEELLRAEDDGEDYEKEEEEEEEVLGKYNAPTYDRPEANQYSIEDEDESDDKTSSHDRIAITDKEVPETTENLDKPIASSDDEIVIEAKGSTEARDKWFQSETSSDDEIVVENEEALEITQDPSNSPTVLKRAKFDELWKEQERKNREEEERRQYEDIDSWTEVDKRVYSGINFTLTLAQRTKISMLLSKIKHYATNLKDTKPSPTRGKERKERRRREKKERERREADRMIFLGRHGDFAKTGAAQAGINRAATDSLPSNSTTEVSDPPLDAVPSNPTTQGSSYRPLLSVEEGTGTHLLLSSPSIHRPEYVHLPFFKNSRISGASQNFMPRISHEIPLITHPTPDIPNFVLKQEKLPLWIRDKRAGDRHGFLDERHYIHRIIEWTRETLLRPENTAKFVIALRVSWKGWSGFSDEDEEIGELSKEPGPSRSEVITVINVLCNEFPEGMYQRYSGSS